MSTIYSAGQFDDAFSPKKLGNWEAGAKEAYYLKPKPCNLTKTQIIVDEKGHLLPGIPRNKSTTWGLLQYYMKNKSKANMAVLSGPGKQQHQQLSNSSNKHSSNSTIEKRMKKLPRYIPKKPRDCNRSEDDLLEYIKEMKLPIVWIIGPPTKSIYQKRKQFSKQLANYLRFGYVNLDEKVQEWKERQTACKCNNNNSSCSVVDKSKSNNSTEVIYGSHSQHALSATSIAPSKLPTSVPPFISVNLISPRSNSAVSLPHHQVLSSQRITFDTALPIERNKILELYKFAMAECLPCEGFVFDTVPFDLVEGLSFEKTFYPATLAIYFAEGIPHKRQLKPRDRRVTAGTMASDNNAMLGHGGKSSKKLISPLEYLERCKKAATGENTYLRSKSHKRLGGFSVTEGEKICKQYGSKTIRIINAEDVDRDTMDFLSELVKKNLEKFHHQTMDGNVKLDCTSVTCGPCGPYKCLPFSSASSSVPVRGEPPKQMARSTSTTASTKYTYPSSFIPEEEEEREVAEVHKIMDSRTVKLPEIAIENEQLVTKIIPALTPTPPSPLPPPPAHVTTQTSDTSISMFSLPPNMFRNSVDGNVTSSTIEEPLNNPWTPIRSSSSNKDRNILLSSACAYEIGAAGGGDQGHAPLKRKVSSELLEKINKLENTVANLNPEEKQFCKSLAVVEEENPCHHYRGGSRPTVTIVDEPEPLPPPTAFEDQAAEEETLTSVIRRAIARQNLPCSSHLLRAHQLQQQSKTEEFDFGASGDYAVASGMSLYKKTEEVPDQNEDGGEEVIEVLEESYRNRRFHKTKQPSRQKCRSRNSISSNSSHCLKQEVKEYPDGAADPFYDNYC